jgi:hypothetical protein
MAATYEFITKQVLGSSATAVTFSNIPQTFTDLMIMASARTDRALTVDILRLELNGQTTGYTVRILEGNGSGASSSSVSEFWGLTTCGANATASTFGNAEVYIPNYTSSQAKVSSSTGCSENNATEAYIQPAASVSTLTAPITSIRLVSRVGANILTGSSFFVCGIRRASADPGVFMDASGGDVLISGGWKIHTFTGSGVLQVNSPGWCEYLVVSGGGAGGQGESNNFGGAGGGGGAGGMVSGSRYIASGPYGVVVGAGGTGTATLGGSGGSGTNSSFADLPSVFAGGGGGGDESPGISGGSGGGRGGDSAGTAGSGVSGQGNAGGVSTGSRSGGGGGGAGQVGNTNGVRRGGDGLQSSISGTSTFYAGGGAGGSGDNTNSSTAGGLGGGGAGGYSGFSTGINGSANTGGGGGGKISNGSSGNGGSGVVIVRYPYR